MIQLNALNVWFGNNHVLRNLSCSVKQGDFIVIVGTNGAGKSTLFDTIAGKVRPDSGSVIIDNVDTTSRNEQQRASMITRIFQNPELNSVASLTVEQNLALANYSRRYARFVDGMQAMPRTQAEHIVRQLNMDPSIVTRTMQQLSGGQRQLIAFAMATQRIPKLLLLDEPTAALDPQAATRLLLHATQFIKQHAITTLLITHDPHIALSIGNKIWVLENGAITKEYDAHEKKLLNPDKLIGQIDYNQLSKG